MARKFWTLCLSRKPSEKKPTITVDSSENVPVKGEKKQILGIFRKMAEANASRKKMGDDFLLSHWGRFLFLEYRDGQTYLVGEERMNEIVSQFCQEG